MAETNLNEAAKFLTSLVRAADEMVATEVLAADAREVFIREMFQSMLRLSEAEAIQAANVKLREEMARESLLSLPGGAGSRVRN